MNGKKTILLDTSILIDYYRKTDNSKTTWVSLLRNGYYFAISVITKYEIYVGATIKQKTFWDSVFGMFQFFLLMSIV